MIYRRNEFKTQIEEQDKKNRDDLFKRSLSLTVAMAERKQKRENRNVDLLRIKAEKTTEMLNSLVLRMDDQVFYF